MQDFTYLIILKHISLDIVVCEMRISRPGMAITGYSDRGYTAGWVLVLYIRKSIIASINHMSAIITSLDLSFVKVFTDVLELGGEMWEADKHRVIINQSS